MGKLGAFTMNKTGRGRAGKGAGKLSGKTAQPKPLIVPKVSALQPRVAAAGSADPLEAPVQLAVLQWTRVANKALDTFGDDPLWQIQLRHDGRPAVSMQLIRHFTEYLAVLNATDESIPSNLHELKQTAGIALQLTGGTVPWRPAWYVAGTPDALLNGLRLILGFVEHRWSHTAPGERAFPGDLRIQLDADPALIPGGELETLPGRPTAVRGLGMSPWAPAPPTGTQTLTFQVEFSEQNHFTGVLAGATWPFRAELEQNGIYGARVEDDGSYVRVVPPVDVSSDSGRTWILNHLMKVLLCETVMHLRVATPPAPDTEAASFLQTLLALPHVHTEK